MIMETSKGNHTKEQLEKLASKLIDRLEQMKASGWQKGWFDTATAAMPQNYDGRAYSGGNAFFLRLYSEMEGYKSPTFITFKQMEAINNSIFKDGKIDWEKAVKIKKGEKATSIMFYDVYYTDKDGHRIPDKKADEMGLRDKKNEELAGMGITTKAFLRFYPVFNIDQTTLPDVLPEKYQKVLDRFKAKEVKDTQGMFESKEIDRMLERQEWVCPIVYDKASDRAFYSPLSDSITVPMKGQFAIHRDKDGLYADGMEYYATIIHEMAHSTKSRLNRDMKDYAKEELVAEMTAAIVSSSMGFNNRIIQNNLEYINSWMQSLKENPQFIRSIVSDVTKASGMVIASIDSQRLAMGESPLMATEAKEKKTGKAEAKVQVDGQLGKVIVFKGYGNAYKIGVAIDGKALLPKTISAEDKKALDSKKLSKHDIAVKYFAKEIKESTNHRRKEKTMSR